MSVKKNRLLRIAVIGAGHWGPNLIRNFHNHQASDVVWVVDRDATNARRIAAGPYVLEAPVAGAFAWQPVWLNR